MGEKFILDACCGGRMFWFNKKHPNTLYVDNRISNEGFGYNPGHRVQPDIVMDFKNLKFKDNVFKLVVFDPPHLFGKSLNTNMTKCYGSLNKETWKDDLKKGFDECWRVLDKFGILIFKWNEFSIRKKEVLELFGIEPLFGHKVQSKVPTHWFCFMKIPAEAEREDGIRLIEKKEGVDYENKK